MFAQLRYYFLQIPVVLDINQTPDGKNAEPNRPRMTLLVVLCSSSLTSGLVIVYLSCDIQAHIRISEYCMTYSLVALCSGLSVYL
jgi:hypothetical protein